MKTSLELPVYTGPRISYKDGQKSSLLKAGPAPKGWKYLKVGDVAPKKNIVLTCDGWKGPDYSTGTTVEESSWLFAVPDQTSPEYVGSETDFLRLRITKRNPKKVTFVIDSQRQGYFDQFEASNGVRIASSLYPQLEAYKRDSLRLFVRGILSLRDSDPVCATASQFKLIAAAAQEFNLSKAKPAKVKPAKVKPAKPKVDLNARIRELEAEVASLKAFKEGVEALLKN